MAILNPIHLFEQAEKLIIPPPAGPPRQVDIRRAISAAYYGVFHGTLAAAADRYIGVTKRTTSQYGLVYRSIDHRSLRSLCDEVRKQTLSARYAPHEPPNGFDPNIKAYALAVLELQEKRHAADYDPMIRMKSADALLVIKTARAAVGRFNRAEEAQQQAFLALLLFPPRSN